MCSDWYIFGFGRGDIILKAIRDGPEHIVNNTEHIVAIVNRIYNDTDCINIVNLIKWTFPAHTLCGKSR